MNPRFYLTRYLFRGQWLALVAVLLLLLHYPAAAQLTERLSGGTPPPPEAAALGKFAETPVSLYSGVPSITIPIYEVQLRGLTLPINLSYHAGGVRVAEIASSVGLGWALQAGGSVSSTILGKDDFIPTGYTNGAWRIPQDRPLEPKYTTNDYLFCMRATGTSPAGTPSFVYTSSFDTQPDLYYYSMCGRSGKFFHTQDGKAHPVPYEPLAIERGNGYTIVDEKGNRFSFQSQEIATTYVIRHGGHSSPQDDYAPQARVFYLSQVETPNHETITLSYDTLTYSYNSLGSYTRYQKSGNDSNAGCADKEATYTENITRVAGLRLSSVRSSRGDFVEFLYSSCSRVDLPRTKALKQIRVHTGSRTRTFDLGFGYFNLPDATSDCDPLPVPPPRHSERYRLKLVSVTESGKPSYVIKYREDLPFPDRISHAQDHWGYFNNNQGMLLPAEPSNGFYTGGTREPDPVMMQTGIIRSLQYPTGGWTEYEFEPNTYLHAASTVVRDSLVQPVSFYAGKDDDSTPLPDGTKNQSVDFTIPATVRPYSMKAYYRTGCGFSVPQTTPQFRLELHGPNNYLKIFGASTDPSKPFTEPLELMPGEYTMKATTIGYCPNDFFKLFWTEAITRSMPASNRLAGGLRIKEIRSFADKTGAEPLRQRYSYSPLNDSTLSSGRVQYIPSYSYITIENRYSNQSQLSVEAECRYVAQSSGSIEPLSNIQGGNVAYTSVQVFQDKLGEHGMTHHTFSWKEDEAPYGHGYPFTPATSFDWQRGHPLQVTQYRRNETTYTYQPVHRIVNHYIHHYTPPIGGTCEDCSNYTLPTQPNETHAIGLNIIVKRPEFFYRPDNGFPVVIPSEFILQSFKYLSTWTYQSQRDEYFYSPSDTTQYRLVKTFYKYDNPAHAQLTRIQTFSGGYDTLTTRNRYALDYDTANATTPVALGIQRLAREHRMTELIEQQQWSKRGNNSYLTAGQLTHYEMGKPSLDLTLQVSSPIPAADFTSSASGGGFLQDWRYRPTMAYERYDGLGNILQARQPYAGPQSFLWGHSATLPIARAANAEYRQLAYTSFEPGSAGRWRFAPTAVMLGGHTGSWCYTLASPVSRDSLPAGDYRLSFWATSKPSVYVNGSLLPATAGQAVGTTDQSGLQQFVYTLQAKATQNEVRLQTTQPLRLDELRLHPTGAQLTTYTHEPLIGLTSQTDAAGRTTRYEYDALGRLLRTRDEGGNIITQQEYHYARP
ncbi:hypothetical protein E5K00_21870 [Hymenobacter aquaticus]|uniref:RHS repeat protein n=1 Tax=Hymenobacter aquaticus TaxID=1867101 RepID=A0A4Z0PTR7_9BACT|nr:RHS repeat domain-containing protein [Hymenobacter aquaticus]TGE20644.1 hypothetical protein E5K00_21870 [Hymenobacter aquaticus]